jgi:hypothetical protein
VAATQVAAEVATLTRAAAVGGLLPLLLLRSSVLVVVATPRDSPPPAPLLEALLRLVRGTRAVDASGRKAAVRPD